MRSTDPPVFAVVAAGVELFGDFSPLHATAMSDAIASEAIVVLKNSPFRSDLFFIELSKKLGEQSMPSMRWRVTGLSRKTGLLKSSYEVREPRLARSDWTSFDRIVLLVVDGHRHLA